LAAKKAQPSKKAGKRGGFKCIPIGEKKGVLLRKKLASAARRGKDERFEKRLFLFRKKQEIRQEKRSDTTSRPGGLHCAGGKCGAGRGRPRKYNPRREGKSVHISPKSIEDKEKSSPVSGKEKKNEEGKNLTISSWEPCPFLRGQTSLRRERLLPLFRPKKGFSSPLSLCGWFLRSLFFGGKGKVFKALPVNNF